MMPRRLSLAARDMRGDEAEGWTREGRQVGLIISIPSLISFLCIHITNAYDSEEQNVSAPWPSYSWKTKGQQPVLIRSL